MNINYYFLALITLQTFNISGMELPEPRIPDIAPEEMELIEPRGLKRPLENPSDIEPKKHKTEFLSLLNWLESLPPAQLLEQISECLSQSDNYFQFWNYDAHQIKKLSLPDPSFFEERSEGWNFIRTICQNIIMDSSEEIRAQLVPLIQNRHGALGMPSLIWEYAHINYMAMAQNPELGNYFKCLMKIFIHYANREQLFEALYAAVSIGLENTIFNTLHSLLNAGINPLTTDAHGRNIIYYINNNLLGHNRISDPRALIDLLEMYIPQVIFN